MSENAIFDGKVSICHTIEYHEEISAAEYDLRIAAQFMNEDELNKVIKYIKRITQNRFPLHGDKKYRLKKNKFYGKEVF